VDGFTVKATSVSGGANDTIKIMRLDNGTNTQLGATITQELADGDSLGIECSGTSISAYYKPAAGAWTLGGTRTDAAHGSAGNLGIYAANTSTALDDFGGGDLVVTPPGSDAAETLRVVSSPLRW
jgi:hypothetical protein